MRVGLRLRERQREHDSAHRREDSRWRIEQRDG
jgi:hypothetical protein